VFALSTVDTAASASSAVHDRVDADGTPASATSSPDDGGALRELEMAPDSIPRQLQLLFARLELSAKAAVPTQHLTRSFGWGRCVVCLSLSCFSSTHRPSHTRTRLNRSLAHPHRRQATLRTTCLSRLLASCIATNHSHCQAQTGHSLTSTRCSLFTFFPAPQRLRHTARTHSLSTTWTS
jgi:hypothetical protein